MFSDSDQIIIAFWQEASYTVGLGNQVPCLELDSVSYSVQAYSLIPALKAVAYDVPELKKAPKSDISARLAVRKWKHLAVRHNLGGALSICFVAQPLTHADCATVFKCGRGRCTVGVSESGLNFRHGAWHLLAAAMVRWRALR